MSGTTEPLDIHVGRENRLINVQALGTLFSGAKNRERLELLQSVVEWLTVDNRETREKFDTQCQSRWVVVRVDPANFASFLRMSMLLLRNRSDSKTCDNQGATRWDFRCTRRRARSRCAAVRPNPGALSGISSRSRGRVLLTFGALRLRQNYLAQIDCGT